MCVGGGNRPFGGSWWRWVGAGERGAPYEGGFARLAYCAYVHGRTPPPTPPHTHALARACARRPTQPPTHSATAAYSRTPPSPAHRVGGAEELLDVVPVVAAGGIEGTNQSQPYMS